MPALPLSAAPLLATALVALQDPFAAGSEHGGRFGEASPQLRHLGSGGSLAELQA